MFPIFEKLLTSKKKVDERHEELFCNIQHISVLSNEIEQKKKTINEIDYKMLTEHQRDVYISLADFFELIDEPRVSMEAVLSKFKHLCELKELQKDISKSASIVEMYSIAEDSHIVLCKDPANCDVHRHYAGNKLRIITARRISELK